MTLRVTMKITKEHYKFLESERDRLGLGTLSQVLTDIVRRRMSERFNRKSPPEVPVIGVMTRLKPNEYEQIMFSARKQAVSRASLIWLMMDQEISDSALRVQNT